jgi:hypothetical protein
MTITLKLLSSALALLAASPAFGDARMLVSVRDNTLYESATGALSNGAGSKMFAGTSGGGLIRRAVVAFDCSTVPPGSVITGAALRLLMTMSHAPNTFVSAHRVTQAWGEGASTAPMGQGGGDTAQPGDATWTHTFSPAGFWTSPGGDFVAEPSATSLIGHFGVYLWNSPGLVADVQRWVNHPGENHGWILVGEEDFAPSAKAFQTHESPFEGDQPLLLLEFLPPCPGDADSNREVNFADLNLLLGQYSQAALGLAGDQNFDGLVDFADLNIVLGNFGSGCE